MNKKTKGFRLVALILAMLMLVTVAVGCSGGSTSSDSSKGGSTSGGTTDSNASSESEYSEPEEERDFEGAEFVIGSHWALPHLFPEPGTSEAGDKMLDRYAEIEEKYNCAITYRTGTPEEFQNEFATSAAAGIKYADVIETNLYWIGGFRRADYLLPLNNIQDIRLDANVWLPAYTNATKYGEDVYGVNWRWYNQIPNCFYMVYFNKRILNEKNQANPYELFDKGEWNWDNFRAIAKNVTDKSAEIDGIVSVDRHFEFAAMRSNGAREIIQDEDGYFKFGLSDDRAYKALEFVRDVIQVDKSFGDYFDGRSAGDFTVPVQRFRDGKAGFLIYHTDVLEWDGLLNAMADDYGVIPFPKGPSGTSDYNSALTGDTRVFCITAQTEDAERAAFILRKIAQPLEGTTVDSWKSSAKRTYFRDNEGFEHYLKAFETADYDYLADLNDSMSLIMNASMSVTRDQSATPAEAMATVRSTIQKYIEENLN